MTARGTVLENTGELVHRLSSLRCSKKMPERVLCVCVCVCVCAKMGENGKEVAR